MKQILHRVNSLVHPKNSKVNSGSESRRVCCQKKGAEFFIFQISLIFSVRIESINKLINFIDYSQSPMIFPLDRRDRARLTINGGHLDFQLYRVQPGESIKSTQGAGDGLGGSEKNRGTVITSLKLAFRGRDRNLTPIPIY